MEARYPALRLTLIGLASLALAMGIGRFAFTPLLPMMREDGIVTIADGGLLASVHFLGYLLGAVFLTKLSLPPRLMLRLSLLAIGAGTAAMGLTDNFSAWLALRGVAGVCSAWTLMFISTYYVAHLAGGGHAACQGWVFSGVGAGIAAAGLACLAFMALDISSSHAWLILGAVSLAATAIVYTAIGSEIPSQWPASKQRKTDRSPLDWRLVIAYGTMGAGYIIPATYLPVMAREIVPSPLIFGWSWPVFGFAAFASAVLAAKLHGRYSNRRIWAVCHVVMAAGLILPVVHPHLTAIIAAGLCVGGTFMIVTMVGMKEAHRIAPRQDVMRHIAVMTASFATGQIAGPVFATVVHGLTGTFSASLLAASVALIVTAATLLRDEAEPRPVNPQHTNC